MSAESERAAAKRSPLINELVMLAPKNKGEVQNCIGVVLGLVDRSDEVVVGTIDRVSALVLFVACGKGSEVMLEMRRVPEACRGNRILHR